MNDRDLLTGFDAYASADELDTTSAADVPATTVPCSALASITTAELGC